MGVNDAREQLEVAKAEVVRLEAAYENLARLHEVATERTVQLAAVIEKAKATRIRRAGQLDQPSPHPILDAADTDSALAEIRAKVWDDGFNAALREVARRQGKSPVVPRRNPYRGEATS